MDVLAVEQKSSSQCVRHFEAFNMSDEITAVRSGNITETCSLESVDGDNTIIIAPEEPIPAPVMRDPLLPPPRPSTPPHKPKEDPVEEKKPKVEDPKKPETDQNEETPEEEEQKDPNSFSPWLYDADESDEEAFLKKLTTPADRVPKVFHSQLLAGDDEKIFYDELSGAYESYLEDHGPSTIFPLGRPTFDISPSRIGAMARVLKDPRLGRGITTFKASDWPHLRSLALKWILGAIRHNPSVTTIHISNAKFSDGDGARIARCLEHSPHLTALELPYLPSTSDHELRPILKTLATNKSITKLDIRYAAYSETGFNMLLNMVSSNTTLVELNVSGSDFSKYDRARRFMQAIIDNRDSKLGILDLPIMRGAIIYLAQMLQYNTSLTSVDLSGISLRSHASLLKNAISNNTKLKRLNLASTSISDSDLSSLIEPLWTNSTITYFDISHNSYLTDETARNISDMLMQNYGIETLLMNDLNFSKDKLAKKLAKSLKMNSSIKHLSICRTKTESAGASALGEALVVNHSLNILDLSNNDIEDSGIIVLIKGFKLNKSLKSISLSNCKFGDSCVKPMISWLSATTTLSNTLNIYGNKISHGSKDSLLAAVSGNPFVPGLALHLQSEESTSEFIARYGEKLQKLFSPIKF